MATSLYEALVPDSHLGELMNLESGSSRELLDLFFQEFHGLWGELSQSQCGILAGIPEGDGNGFHGALLPNLGCLAAGVLADTVLRGFFEFCQDRRPAGPNR
jgi:hypothetical protein